jgi:AcrR family transcriptional regulator
MSRDLTRRSDAERNHEAILAAALEALTESADVSLNAIAKRSNVANATLYRHFPTREQLVLEVYSLEVHNLVAAADELLEELSPSEALESWVARLAQYAMTKHGLASALQVATTQHAESFPDTYGPIVGALAKLLAAAEEAGNVKPGLIPDDIILLFAGLFQMDPSTDWQTQSARLYHLVLGGLQVATDSSQEKRFSGYT